MKILSVALISIVTLFVSAKTTEAQCHNCFRGPVYGTFERGPMCRVVIAPHQPVRTYFRTHQPIRRTVRGVISVPRYILHRQPVRSFFRNHQPIRRTVRGVLSIPRVVLGCPY